MHFSFIETLSDSRKNQWVVLAAVAILFLSYFLHAGGFGYYEDDFGHITYEGIRQLRGLVPAVIRDFGTWFTGRPLGVSLLRLFPFFGYQLGDEGALYTIGFLMVATNIFVLFRLLNQTLGASTAALGILFFVLFPADTTKAYLCHMFQLHTTLFFLLTAYLCYPKYKVWSYFLALFSLLDYETCYPLFIMAPWLTQTADAPFTWKKLAGHTLIMASILAIVSYFRTKVGDHRMVGMEKIYGSQLLLFERFFGALWIGPWVSLSAFVKAPALIWEKRQEASFWYLPIVSILAYLALRMGLDTRSDKKLSLRTLKAATCFLPLAYIFAFTHYPPEQLAGRGTSVHFASSFALSLFLAVVFSFLIQQIRIWQIRNVVMGGLALYFGVLSSYGSLIQNDQIAVKKYQQSIWQQMEVLAPDMGPTSLVAVIIEGRNRYRFIKPDTELKTFKQVYRLPIAWEDAPRIRWFAPNWTEDKKHFESSIREFFFPTEPEYWNGITEMQGRSLIVLVEKDGKLSRLASNLKVAQEFISVPPPGVPVLHTLEPRRLWAYFHPDQAVPRID